MKLVSGRSLADVIGEKTTLEERLALHGDVVGTPAYDHHLASISWDGTLRLWLDDLPTDTQALRSWMMTVAGSP
ncbi:MAG TPA: hypothetical protein VNA24_04620 [Hyalangium sp.]|nr:hypothetical protein [Hyalangium sp.]